MGTFHQDKGELHGITVVVDTVDGRLFVGRCDEANDAHVILLDVDSRPSGEDAGEREEYLRRAAQFGIFKSLDRIVLPTVDVAKIRRLGDLAS